MINIDKYGRAYTQVYSVAEAYRVPDTRDIYVMKIPDYYKQKLLRE
jgi:predicted nucleotidyltransferase